MRKHVKPGPNAQLHLGYHPPRAEPQLNRGSTVKNAPLEKSEWLPLQNEGCFMRERMNDFLQPAIEDD